MKTKPYVGITAEPVSLTQPHDADLSWSKARLKVIELYQQGVHYTKIAAQTGVKTKTVHTWITRAGLVKNRQSSAEDKPIPNHNAKVKDNLGRALVKATSKLDSLRAPKSLKAITQQAKVIQAIAEPASLVFGWGQGQSSTLISIQSYTQGIVDQGQVPDQSQGRIYDMEPGQLESDSDSVPNLSLNPAQAKQTPGTTG